MTHADVKRVTDNNNTKILIEWLGSMIKTNKYIISPQFFHRTHSKRDRQILVILVKDFFKEIESIDVVGEGVTIKLKAR